MKASSMIIKGIVAFLMVSCSTIDSSRLEDLSIRQSPAPLLLKPAFDLYMIREDLVRATHTEQRTTVNNGIMTTTSVQVPNSYHDLCIDFGNGIMLDFNDNLFVDLLRFYNLDQLKKFSIQKKVSGFTLSGNNTFEYDGYKYKSLSGVIWNANREGNRIDLEWGLLKKKESIIYNEDQIVITTKFLGSDVVKSAKLISPTLLKVDGFWKDNDFVMESSNKIIMGNYFQIIHNTDHISILYTGIFGMTTEWTFLRTQNGFIFFNKENYGVEVVKTENVISIFWNGKKSVEYLIKTE